MIPKLKHCLISSEYPRLVIMYNSISTLYVFIIYRDEQQRLEEMSRLKYKIKIIVNEGVVSETKERCIPNKFLC